MQKQLENLGLSRNESKIYIYLLKKGSTTTGSIIKQTKISNSRVYESLNTLISKGLVTYNVQKKGKHFQASTPEKFLELEEERRKKIESLVPDLIKLESTEKEETETMIYEGFEGFKTAFKRMIDNCPIKGTIYILGFSEQAYSMKTLRTFITNINLKSVKKKHKLKIILDKSVKETFGKDREREKLVEVRYMPRGYISPMAIDIVEDEVFLILWEEEPSVFVIKNKRIADSFKTYFNFLWKLAK